MGLGNQRGQLQALRPSLCDPRLILPFVQQFLHPSSIWFACALPLRQRTKRGGDVCSLPTSALPLPPAPLLLLSPEPFFSLPRVLRETEGNFFPFEMKETIHGFAVVSHT